MMEKEVDHPLLSLHHVFQVDLGWCSRFVSIVRGLGRFWISASCSLSSLMILLPGSESSTISASARAVGVTNPGVI